ncbi:sensor histidine kinase [Paenibacillus thalictri]|uniref:sensor histidine kinase n=1 Tax=Paenibacillus thalictri TaxID=2527873 RepID=UPI001F1087A7|nr:HAMP domain-containing sensor histidine kinase [Paenibacillus thalictri]
MKKLRIRYRFTFFQRQVLSHLLIAVLILALLSGGFVYYFQKQVYKSETEELVSAGRAVAKLMQRETEEPDLAVNAYRTLLAERKISFIMLDKSGELLYRDSKMDFAFRTKAFLDQLRSHIFTMKDNQSFIAKSTNNEQIIVVPRQIKLKAGREIYLFVLTSHRGLASIWPLLKEPLLYTAGIVGLLAVIVSIMFSRSLSRSIRSIQQATRQIAQGNLSARSPVRRSDELGDLSNDFNTMADRLEEASHKLQQYDARRRHFIMDATHELRTPLTSIRGIIEGLKNNFVTQPEERYKYYTIIEKETFRLIRLINELLDVEKIESGMISLNKQQYSLKELMEIVAESLEVLIEEKKLHIVIECEPQVLIYGDYDRLTQILINLVKNSIQFTDYGTIKLKAAETERSTCIEISDTGKGISKEEQQLIWERFYKADPSRNKNKSETGLGLSIVKQLVEAHQGTIAVDSAPGIGTVFTIILPKGEAETPALPQSSA